MVWQAVIFSHEQIAALDHVKFEDEFDLLYSVAGNPRGMTLYELRTFPMHPIYYVTPDSLPFISKLLQQYEVIGCKEPSPKEIVAIAGDMYTSKTKCASTSAVPRPSRPSLQSVQHLDSQ